LVDSVKFATIISEVQFFARCIKGGAGTNFLRGQFLRCIYIISHNKYS